LEQRMLHKGGLLGEGEICRLECTQSIKEIRRFISVQETYLL
jgi:hypothetical protein